MKPHYLFLAFVVCLFSASALTLNENVNFTPSAANVTYVNLVNTSGITSLIVTNTTFAIDLLSMETTDSSPVYFSYNPVARSLFINYTSSKTITLGHMQTVGNVHTLEYSIYFNGTLFNNLTTAASYVVPYHGEWTFIAKPASVTQTTFHQMIDTLGIIITFMGILIAVAVLAVILMLIKNQALNTVILWTLIWTLVMVGLLVGVGILIFSNMSGY